VGDVRVPAACCGVLGFRSSHGAISLEGTIPVASSCDALGELLMSTLLIDLRPHFKKHSLDGCAVMSVNGSYSRFHCLEVQDRS
jgi:hypothetical protein